MSVNLLLELIISIFILVSCPILRGIPQTLILFFSPTLYSVLIYEGFLRGDKILTLKRLLALQSIQEILYLPLVSTGCLLTFVFSQSPCSTIFLMISIGIALSSFISTLVMLGFLRKRTLIILAISLLYTFLQSSRWLILSLILVESWVKIILPLTISFSLCLLFLFIIGLKWEKYSWRNPLEIFKAYLEYYLNKNPEPFETILEEMSKKEDLALSLLLLIPRAGESLSIFGLSAHFGPFGMIGGSSLPSRLIKEFENNGLRIVLLRNLSDHRFNLPSGRQVEEIRKKMMAALSSAEYLGKCRASIIQKEAEGYCITAIRICSYCIVLLSCPGYSVEDLPPEWLPEFSDIVSRHGLTTLIIADAHNSIDSSNWKVSEPDREILSRLLHNALEILKEVPQKDLKIGFNRILPTTLPKDEIGPGGISTLVFNTEGENHVLILIDGNNMVSGLRDYLINNLKSLLDISTLEIITTDTHLLTGIKKSKKGYFPIGFKTGREFILQSCLESINGAMKSLSPCSVKVWIGRVDGVKITGEIFNMFENFVKYCDKVIRILFFAITLLNALLLSFL
ncbi:MAG: DUF2070 family protein [Thermoproteota archaeon]